PPPRLVAASASQRIATVRERAVRRTDRGEGPSPAICRVGRCRRSSGAPHPPPAPPSGKEGDYAPTVVKVQARGDLPCWPMMTQQRCATSSPSPSFREGGGTERVLTAGAPSVRISTHTVADIDAPRFADAYCSFNEVRGGRPVDG